MTKLAIICAAGLDNFLQWAAYLPGGYVTKVFPTATYGDIQQAVEWGDVIWLEWANEVAIGASCNLKGKPAIVRLHSYEAFTDLPGQIHWPSVHSLIYVAEHVREITERYNTIPPHVSTAIVANGVDLDNTPDLNPGHGHDIAVVGAINHKKAPELVLQIIHLLPNKYRIHWAGAFQDPRYEVYLNHMVASMGLGDRVIFYGHVADMNEFWRGKNYLLQTSVHEGHSLAITEAMARNIRPVIHRYHGADRQYPYEMLFNSATEAAAMIVGAHWHGFPRDYVRRNGWTIQEQAAQHDAIIREAMG